MPDDIAAAAPIAPAATEAPAAAPAPVAPVGESVSSTPVTTSSPTETATSSSEATASPSAAPAAAKPANEFQPSLLDSATAKPDSVSAPQEGSPAGDKPADAKTDAPGETPPAPVKYEFVYPEHIKPEEMNAERMSAYTGILGEAKVAPEVGQKLLDLHLSELGQVTEAIAQRQWDVFNETQARWKNEVMSDPVLGRRDAEGNMTAISTIMSLVDQYGGNAAERQALMDAFRITGAANNPAVLRFMHRAGEALAKEGSPHPAPPPRAAPANDRERRANTRYGTTTPLQPQR